MGNLPHGGSNNNDYTKKLKEYADKYGLKFDKNSSSYTERNKLDQIQLKKYINKYGLKFDKNKQYYVEYFYLEICDVEPFSETIIEFYNENEKKVYYIQSSHDSSSEIVIEYKNISIISNKSRIFNDINKELDELISNTNELSR